MINNNKKIFDILNYSSNEEFDQILNNLGHEQSLFFMTLAIKSAYNRNTFSMEESELISKCLRVLQTPNQEITENKKGD